MESPIQTNYNAGVQSLERFNKAVEELRDYEKKNLRINRFRLTCSVLAVLLCVALIAIVAINLRGIVKKVGETADVLTETGEQLSAVAKDLNKVDFEKLGTSLQGLADMGADTLAQVYDATGGLDTLVQDADTAMQHINSVDFEKLNDGIQHLNDVLEPIANFFNIFH